MGDYLSLGNALSTNNWTTATSTLTLASPYQYSQTVYLDGNGRLLNAKPREKTNLDWLDERVNEMRVRL